MGKRGKKAKTKRALSGAGPGLLKDDEIKSKEKESSGKKQLLPKYTVDQLLDKAAEYIDTFEYELAQKFCQRALETEPKNVRAIEMSGTLKLELGDMDGAQKCFEQAIEVKPEDGHSKYMYLGQLFTGDEAIRYFVKGIQLMKKHMDQVQEEQNEAAASSNTKVDITGRDLSQAHCSVAEIYLTDECFEDDADVKCKDHLDKALEADGSNPEAYHLLASYWLSKDNVQVAKETMKKGVSLWLPKLQEAVKSEGADVDPVEVSPLSYPSRIQAAKILIEVEDYDCATEVLELLLDEEDEVVEVWYLLGWANYLQSEDYRNNARFYLNKAKEVNGKVGCDDDQMVQHIEELLQELGPGEEEETEDAADSHDEDPESDEDDNLDGMEVDSQGGHTDKITHSNTDSENAMEH